MGAGPAVHGIEVVDQGLHGLVSAFLGFGIGVAPSKVMDPAVDGLVSAQVGKQEGLPFGGVIGVVLGQTGEETRFLPDGR